MATIEKRTYWVDPATGKKCRRGTPGAEAKTSRVWSVRYRDARGRPRRAKGYIDKRATLQLAAKLDRHAARGNEGMLDPFKEHTERPLREHLEEYLADLQARGRDDKYRQNVRGLVTRVLAGAGWTHFAAISGDAMTTWMRGYLGKKKVIGVRRKDKGVSAAAVNGHLEAMQSFLNWCSNKQRARFPENPLAGVEKLTEERVFVRKSLAATDVVALLTKAPPERAAVYLFAVSTGLRRQEIADLVWGDVVIDGPTPFLKLRIAATKARRADTLGLRGDVAEMLRKRRPAKWAPAGKVFEVVPTIAEYRADLVAAGVELPAAGSLDVIDFHGLRTTLGTLMAMMGTNPRVAMEVMRHTDLRLTQKVYTDPRVFDTAGVVNALPITAAPESQQLRATGTTDHAPADQVGTGGTQKAAGNSRQLSATGGTGGGLKVMQLTAGAGDSRPLSVTVGDAGLLGAVGFEPTAKRGERPAKAGGLGRGGHRWDTGYAEGVLAVIGRGPAEPQDAAISAEAAEVGRAYPGLPAAVRAGILAMVRAAVGGGE